MHFIQGEATVQSRDSDSIESAGGDALEATSSNTTGKPIRRRRAHGAEAPGPEAPGPAPKRRRGTVQQAPADSVTQENGAATAAPPAAAGETEQKTFARRDGKKVSSKDGRIVASENDLKSTYDNNYRNAENLNTFYGKHLTLGEAFKLACLVQYGPTLPIESSGHTSMRTALFLRHITL